MSLPYGFMLASDDHIIVDPEKVNIIKTIYQQYLSGMSLGGIANFLFEHEIPSPKGKVVGHSQYSVMRFPIRSILAISSVSMTSSWCKVKKVGAAILMKIPTNGRPPGTTPRVY